MGVVVVGVLMERSTNKSINATMSFSSHFNFMVMLPQHFVLFLTLPGFSVSVSSSNHSSWNSSGMLENGNANGGGSERR